MSDRPVQLGFKSYAPKQWPTSISKNQRKEYEHTRCRGWRPDEIQRLKAFGLLEEKKRPAAGPIPIAAKGPFVQ